MLLVQGHPRDLQPYNQNPRHSPAPNDLCIRRCRAQPNNVTPHQHISSDEQLPYYFLNIIICCTCYICPRAAEGP